MKTAITCCQVLSAHLGVITDTPHDCGYEFENIIYLQWQDRTPF